jgi:hypothetical protein
MPRSSVSMRDSQSQFAGALGGFVGGVEDGGAAFAVVFLPPRITDDRRLRL